MLLREFTDRLSAIADKFITMKTIHEFLYSEPLGLILEDRLNRLQTEAERELTEFCESWMRKVEVKKVQDREGKTPILKIRYEV